MARLVVRDLRKSYGGKAVIDGISFDVSDGEFCILLGPSGCGKSTILRLIAGLDQKDSGEIHIDGREVSDLMPKERDVAMVFQSYALYPHLNVHDNMAFPLAMQKWNRKDIDAKVGEVAALLGIEGLLLRKPKELSGGQRQRVAIGRAIVRRPKLFLFDEPLSNLDAKLRAAMRVELAHLHRQLGTTTLYVTHDQTEAMTLGQKIVLLDSGVIQQTGTPDDLYARPANTAVAGLIGVPQMNLIAGRIESAGDRLIFRSDAFTLPVDARKELRPYQGRETTIGIRPEALAPGTDGISAKVEFVEHLGSEAVIYALAGQTRLVAKVSADFGKSVGEAVVFSLNDNGVHFFFAGSLIGRTD